MAAPDLLRRGNRMAQKAFTLREGENSAAMLRSAGEVA